jgi:hypothetical protein
MILLVFALNLAITVAVEGGIAALLFRRRDIVYYSFLCNLLTNPALNLLLLAAVQIMGKSAYWPAVAVLETAAMLAEAYVYRMLLRFGTVKSLWVSFLLNASSYAAGLLFYAAAGNLFLP